MLRALAAPEPDLPTGPTYATLERRLSRWVDLGLQEIRETRWQLGLHLDERPGRDALAVEQWLHADDDPTLSLPVSLLLRGDDGFAFVRDGDPVGDLEEQLADLAPVLESLEFDELGEAELDTEATSVFLRELMPELERRNVPVLLPTAWVRSPARIKANVSARVGAQSSGFLSTEALASFDWRLAVGDVDLGDDELAELAAAKSPVVRVAGRWQALRQADVQRAIRFLERRKRGGGVVDLVRTVSGLETDEAGLELGDVTLDTQLSELLDGEARFEPLATPKGMQFDLFGFQERGHGWLRLLGDRGIGAILADDMGLGKTVQAIAMLLSERENGTTLGPTLVVCPMSVARQWVSEVERFAPSLRVHLHHGSDRLADDQLIDAVSKVDVVVTSYDIASRDVDTLAAIAWDRVLLDEAQDVKNPQTKRARSLRRIPARRRLAMTGTPLENHLGELWALMDILNPGLLGSRESFARTFARPIEIAHDEQALERLRAIVQPFILRRQKDSPEVEFDLPPITVEKDYCRLTVEQASLYRATVDHWMPRIEAHEDRFGRRGAVLAMLAHLKQVCNHPEMLVHTGAAARRPFREARAPGRVAARGSGRRQGARLHAVPELRPARSVPRRAPRPHGRLLPRPPERAAARGAPGGVRDRGRAVAARDLDPRRRSRSQPAGGEPRLPLRPLVEPGGRAAGDRPRLPARAAQAGVRAQPDLPRHARGADRRAARLEARAGREGARRPRRRLARRPRPRCDPRRRRARTRLDGGGGGVKGPWARSVAAAVTGDAHPEAEVDELDVEIGRVTARVGECEIVLAAERVPRATWIAMLRYAKGMGPLEEAVKGRIQSTHLDHLLAEDWGERLIPRPGQIRRTCTCDPAGTCEHVAAVGLAFANAIDGNPVLFLRWRGCVDEPTPEVVQGDPWVGGELPAPAAPRALPVGAVLKRLGPSGIQIGDEDLADVLQRAYEAFAG